MPAVGLGVQLKRLFSKEVGIIESPTWTAAFHPAARSQDTVCPDERGIVLPRLQYGFASSQGVLLVVVLVSMLHGRLSVVATMSYSGFSSPPPPPFELVWYNVRHIQYPPNILFSSPSSRLFVRTLKPTVNVYSGLAGMDSRL